MTRVLINSDEVYPIYSLSASAGNIYEMTDEDIAFVMKATEEYEKAQSLLENVMRKAKEHKYVWGESAKKALQIDTTRS